MFWLCDTCAVELAGQAFIMQEWRPHPYQKRAVKFLLEHAGAGLFLDPGLGKTACALAAIKILQSKGLAKRTLIIAPVRVCYNVWPEQIDEEWEDFAHLRYAIVHGNHKEDMLHADADIYLTNPLSLIHISEPTRPY